MFAVRALDENRVLDLQPEVSCITILGKCWTLYLNDGIRARRNRCACRDFSHVTWRDRARRDLTRSYDAYNWKLAEPVLGNYS